VIADELGAVTQIESVEHAHGQETVYDLTVEEDHSFVTEAGVAHNCGSGTTAYVAEQWGRRWITIDTSRVALALARTRLMTARFPYYLLADSPEGMRREMELHAGLSPHPPLHPVERGQGGEGGEATAPPPIPLPTGGEGAREGGGEGGAEGARLRPVDRLRLRLRRLCGRGGQGVQPRAGAEGQGLRRRGTRGGVRQAPRAAGADEPRPGDGRRVAEEDRRGQPLHGFRRARPGGEEGGGRKAER
jgi:hypothetical protein